ncbi:hypothetical protein [uncultured Traorella sp.]|uniref:hypothetical protein n=1 Tax=uncultured Traorella sp. TaxID=1929048 RepID=UPI0025EBC88F|nr:hypothetical protein [uncultured Traorella sp.]
MDNRILIAVIVGILVVVVMNLVRKYLEKRYTIKLMKAIMTDEDEFLKLVDSFMVKYLFPPYNREFMRLNNYIARGADKKVKEQISLMEQMRMNRNQRFAVYQTAFQYFITINSESNAKNMQRKMNAFIDENKLDPEMKKTIDMDMKMYFDKDISTLPYIDEKLENCDDADKAVWNLKKAYVLKANQKLEEAKECIRLVMQYTNDPTQKQIMQDLLDNNLKDL